MSSRTKLWLLLLAAVAVPCGIYAYNKSAAFEDQLDVALKEMGFLPINPPSNLMSIGSLYFVDNRIRNFRTVCRASQDFIDSRIIKSPSTRMVADRLNRGTYSLDLTLNLAKHLGRLVVAGANDVSEYKQKITFRLENVQLYEIDLASSRKAMRDMMKDEDCSGAVQEVIEANGYVCQGQAILEANAEYKVSSEDTIKIATKVGHGMSADQPPPAEVRQAIQNAVKDAAREQAQVDIVEQSGRLITGTSLRYGVAMNPTCLAPHGTRFARILPKDGFQWVANFVKFNIIEAVLPRTEESEQTASLAVQDSKTSGN